MIESLDFLQPYLAPAKIALVVVVSVWAFIEYVCFWLPEKWRRMLAAALGQASLFGVHWSGLYNFGAGPAGWALVLILGMLVSPLASIVHDQIVNRFFPKIKLSRGKSVGPAPTEPAPATGTEEV